MASTKSFGAVPVSAKQQSKPFEVHFDDQKLEDLKTLVRLSPVSKETYETQDPEGDDWRFGVPRSWMLKAKQFWADGFDWRKHEAHINSFPNYTATVTDEDDTSYNLHFCALFSENPSAIPLVFLHGWPGSFLEFLPILSLLSSKYTPSTLPYHIIVPSLPGFAFSSAPPLHRGWGVADSARLINNLLTTSLGFTSYITQGGDIGSMVARTLAVNYPECIAVHLNFCFMLNAPAPDISITSEEEAGLTRAAEFNRTGNAYGRMHGTRPATVSHVLSSSPVALLAWLAEKFHAWSDRPTRIPLENILTYTTLYWLTNCFPSSIYTYREDFGGPGTPGADPGYFHGRKEVQVDEKKPLGYSWFPGELIPAPVGWVERTGRLVSWKSHEFGGHFAAVERPEVLLGDVVEFVGKVLAERGYEK